MKKILLVALLVTVCFVVCSCDDEYIDNGSKADVKATLATASTLQENQPTPTDIEYSLERYNLIRRAYWVNGQREKAMSLPCEIADIPLGYVVLFTEAGGVVGRFCVQGKVSSLNSYLTPDSEYYEKDLDYASKPYDEYTRAVERYSNQWIADVDGSYGENDTGIFFFTPDGKYIEWNGGYLYSDIPFVVENPVVSYEEEK